ncbi:MULTISPECIES: hypothetical protein [Candidatus Ichthyocystis]|uniref:Putative coiled coil protein n=1 Tax=Candidatus Ichthyocystis hellenicum TaxID=1561003 RepID=A0A0S4M227_9BURK|nr:MULTISPECIES: hypothetical protein [Ichthyocystis]CUT17831.1 putative coiled coil protein [Candidatus Ichthyocystis hellenicum]
MKNVYSLSSEDIAEASTSGCHGTASNAATQPQDEDREQMGDLSQLQIDTQELPPQGCSSMETQNSQASGTLASLATTSADHEPTEEQGDDIPQGSAAASHHGTKKTTKSANGSEKIKPQKPNKWSANEVMAGMQHSRIYETVMSEMYIDHDEFQENFLEKTNKLKILENFYVDPSKRDKKRCPKLKLDYPKLKLDSTYDHVRTCIIKMISPAVKNFERKSKESIIIKNGMYLEELRMEYLYNNDFFPWLEKACATSVKILRECSDISEILKLTHGLIQEKILIGNGVLVQSTPNIRNIAAADMYDLLISNILSTSKKITTALQSLPKDRILEGCFSFFNNMYIDNNSLLKAKSALECTLNELAKAEELNKLMTETCNSYDPEKHALAHKFNMSRRKRKGDNLFSEISERAKALSMELINNKLKKGNLSLSVDSPVMLVECNQDGNVGDKIRFANESEVDKLIYELTKYLSKLAVESYMELCSRRLDDFLMR